MADRTGSRFRLSAKPIIIFAHLLVIAATTLVLFWLLNFRKGSACDSRTKAKIFNMHPFLMAIGYFLVAGEAIMISKKVPSERACEIFHLILHCVALVAGTIGIYAAFRFHNERSIPHMNTLHSWIGISTFCLFGLQCLLGVYSFMFPGANLEARPRITTWHMFVSKAIFVMAIKSADTGLVERFIILGLPHNREDSIMNITGLLILLSGVVVILRTRLTKVQVFILIVILLLASVSAELETVTLLALRCRQEAVILNFTGKMIQVFGVAVILTIILPRPQ